MRFNAKGLNYKVSVQVSLKGSASNDRDFERGVAGDSFHKAEKETTEYKDIDGSINFSYEGSADEEEFECDLGELGRFISSLFSRKPVVENVEDEEIEIHESISDSDVVDDEKEVK